jgi:hypothetical protein
LSSSEFKFNPEILEVCGDVCPPSAAEAVTLKIYRGIRDGSITAQEFLSHVERELPSDPTNCEHWGLSVWISEPAVEHARRTYRSVRRMQIAVGEVTPDDGVLLATPTKQQPEHHTFWKVFGKDFSHKFQVAWEPANDA